MIDRNTTDIDAERGLCCAALWSPERAYDAEGITGRDFSDPALGALWAALTGLLADGREITPWSVADRAKLSADLVLDVLGRAAVPAAAIAEAGQRVAAGRVRRDVHAACVDALQSPDYGTALLDRLTTHLQAIAVPESGAILDGQEFARRYAAKIEVLLDARASGRPVDLGYQTGLGDLDELLGGLVRGGVCVVAARPSDGKSALMLGICWHNAKAGIPTAYFSLEDPLDSLGHRIAARETGIDSRQIQRGIFAAYGNEWPSFVKAAKAIYDSALHVCESPYDTTSRLIGDIRRLVLSKGVKLVAIDYVQKLWEPGAARQGDRNGELTWISDRLQKLAKSLDIAILLGSQLRRISPDEVPSMGHLRESGALEQNAQQILMLHRKPSARATGKPVTLLRVEKNKDGATGFVYVSFDAPQVRFRDASQGEVADYES